MPDDPNQYHPSDVATLDPADDFEAHFTEPNPRAWVTNNAAGVHYLTRKYPFDALIKFNADPPPDVIDYIITQGFRWKPLGKWWSRRIGYSTAAEDREIARRTFDAVVDMLMQEKCGGRQARLF